MMKPTEQIKIFLLFITLTLFSCSSNHLLHLRFLPQVYTFEYPNGTISRDWYIQSDSSKKKNKTTLRTEKFDRDDINKIYQNIDSAIIQELTVKNLKEDFTDYDYTFISIYYGCPITMKYELKQFRQLVDTIAQIMENPYKIAFVFVSTSYDFYRIKYILNSYDYHYQSYLIPTDIYGDKNLIKRLNFITELCPKCYEENKIFAVDNSMFLLDRTGQIIKFIDYTFDEKGYKEIMNFEKIRDELIDLAKH